MFLITAITCLIAINLCESTPVPSGGNQLKLDQRQEGEWNVRADLQNFIILIAPSNVNSGLTSLALLDLFRKTPSNNKKSLAKVKNGQHQQQQQKVQNADGQTSDATLEQSDDNSSSHPIETQHFIESKTAPYHVDLTQTRTNLVKLHPSVDNYDDPEDDAETRSDLMIAAQSPAVSLLTSSDNFKRNSRAYVISIPIGKGKYAKGKTSNKKDNDNAKEKELMEPENWRLLGDGIENCGPGLYRDSKGICRLVEQ